MEPGQGGHGVTAAVWNKLNNEPGMKRSVSSGIGAAQSSDGAEITIDVKD